MTAAGEQLMEAGPKQPEALSSACDRILDYSQVP
jgi:hypothetical protein